ncbi:MAG: sulfatase-like hydrolase/transferase [Rikenellaceae bacterium]
MNQKLLYGAVAPVAAAALVGCGAQPAPKDQILEKPNVVFIFADDVNYECLGALNRDVIHTPNLDKLLARSTQFTHAFNQGAWNGAVSAASRAMLITGKNLWNAATYNPYVTELNRPDQWAKGAPALVGVENKPFETTWPEYMKEAGYDTYMSGKWHVSKPPQKLFDTVAHVRGGMPQQSQDCYDRQLVKGQVDKWRPDDTSYGGYWEGGTHWSEVLTADALSYIDIATQKDEPFFMYLASNAPHDPRQSPEVCLNMYDVEDILVPENFMPIYTYADEIGCGNDLRDEWLAPFPRTEYAVQVNRQEYFACITHLDEQVGKILEALEKSGKMDETYIIFTADHGLAIGDHGMLGKQNMYDASMRMPLFISGPGIPEGQKIDNMVYMQDVMATTLDLAGSESGMQHSDFQSLLPLATGATTDSRSAVYGSYLGLQRMVRTDKYKMIIYPNAEVVRLYDMENDPYEQVDLAGDEANIPLMKELLVEFKRLQKEVGGDPLDVDPYFNAYISKL